LVFRRIDQTILQSCFQGTLEHCRHLWQDIQYFKTDAAATRAFFYRSTNELDVFDTFTALAEASLGALEENFGKFGQHQEESKKASNIRIYCTNDRRQPDLKRRTLAPKDSRIPPSSAVMGSEHLNTRNGDIKYHHSLDCLHITCVVVKIFWTHLCFALNSQLEAVPVSHSEQSYPAHAVRVS